MKRLSCLLLLLLSVPAFAEHSVECRALSAVINDKSMYYLDGEDVSFEVTFQKGKNSEFVGYQTVDFEDSPYSLIISLTAYIDKKTNAFTLDTFAVLLTKKDNGKNISLGGSTATFNGEHFELGIMSSEVIQLVMDNNLSFDDETPPHIKLTDMGLLKNGDFLSAHVDNCEIR